jgi:hypothetical protein
MTILFVGNVPSDFGLPPTTYSTLATGRDTAYTISSLAIPGLVQATINLPAYTGTFWLHAVIRASTVSSSLTDSSFVFRDAAGVAVADLRRDQNVKVFRIRSLGDTTVQGGGSITLLDATVYTLDIRVEVTASVINTELFVNGTSVSTATAANTVGGKGVPRKVEMVNTMVTTSGTLVMSEVICANESTVGMRLLQRAPSTAGTFSDWSGALANLADNDSNTVVVSDAAGERLSFGLTAYGGPGSPASIRAVVANTAARRVSGTPSQLAHFVRIGGTNYDLADAAVTVGEVVRQVWDQNPATSTPWTVASLSAIEVGIKSAT